MIPSEINTTCPYCGRENDLATGANIQERPQTGHISICWGCGNAAVFDFALPTNVRKPTLVEYIAIFADPTMQKARQVYQVARTPREANRMMNL